MTVFWVKPSAAEFIEDPNTKNTGLCAKIAVFVAPKINAQLQTFRDDFSYVQMVSTAVVVIDSENGRIMHHTDKELETLHIDTKNGATVNIGSFRRSSDPTVQRGFPIVFPEIVNEYNNLKASTWVKTDGPGYSFKIFHAYRPAVLWWEFTEENIIKTTDGSLTYADIKHSAKLEARISAAGVPYITSSSGFGEGVWQETKGQ